MWGPAWCSWTQQLTEQAGPGAKAPSLADLFAHLLPLFLILNPALPPRLSEGPRSRVTNLLGRVHSPAL